MLEHAVEARMRHDARHPRHRLLTGKDDANFSKRVSEALSQGYELHDSPAATFNGQDVIVAQAIICPEAQPSKP